MLNRRAVGTFSTYEITEIALRELRDSGFMMDYVSVVGKDIDRHSNVAGANTSSQIDNAGSLDDEGNRAGETAKDGAMAGGAVGGVTGLLVGLGALAIPGVGPVMLAGAAATALATAISGGAIGAAAGSLAGGLVGLGIPADRAKIYSDRVSQGSYMVIVEGSEDDLTRAESIFSKHNIHEWYVYDLPSDSTQPLTAGASRRR